MTVLLKLLLAHMIGDFVLQPDRWVKAKEASGFRSWHLYVHALIHGVLVIIFFRSAGFLLPAAVVVVTHAVIDAAKVYLQKASNQRTWFYIDQVLHVTVLAVIWVVIDGPVISLPVFHDNLLFLVTLAVFITTPASAIIRTVISQWTPNPAINTVSLQNAGKYIGILERLLVFVFVITNHWEGIGFLVAAKSVFRFGDLRNAHDIQLTEYVLIGTLLSFGIALLCGLLVTFSM